MASGTQLEEQKLFTRHWGLPTASFSPLLLLTVDRNLELDKLQRGPYLDMPSCSAANEKNPDVNVRTQFGAYFAVVICTFATCLCNGFGVLNQISIPGWGFQGFKWRRKNSYFFPNFSLTVSFIRIRSIWIPWTFIEL